QMQDRQCYSWFLEDSVKSLEKIAAVDDLLECENYYLRFSQLWSIADYKLVALKELARWREDECRRRNMPRNWLLKNQTIISIINTWPVNTAGLGRVEEMRSKNIREDGVAILAILDAAKAGLAQFGEVQKINKPIDPIWNKRFKKIRQIAVAAAEHEGIAVEMLLRKKDLEALVRTRQLYGEYRIPEGLQGWREQLIGDQVLEKMRQFDE
ncbi:MAG: HRDC domain-containing protein, partial [Pseudomonadales bacterium]|nr:HRDC domain-containing protein [Pseudomonadales bacterium]